MKGSRYIQRGLALLLLLGALIAGLVRFVAAKSPGLAARENAMEMLGARIAMLRPKSNVLVLSNPFSQDAGYSTEKVKYERAGIRGLRKGLGGDSDVKVVFPKIRPEYRSNPNSIFIPADSATPLSFLVLSASIDELAAENPKHTVIVSLIGLPAEVERLKIWSEKDPRCFALLSPDMRVLGPPKAVVQAFQRDKLLAAVTHDPDRPGQHLIITRDNVRQILDQQPKSLGY